jgi:hypothetical protein
MWLYWALALFGGFLIGYAMERDLGAWIVGNFGLITIGMGLMFNCWPLIVFGGLLAGYSMDHGLGKFIVGLLGIGIIIAAQYLAYWIA